MFPRRIGILGGAFDPVHLGHLVLAHEAHEALGLAKVIFMPGAQTPLKGRPPLAAASDRLAMLAAAVAGRADWEVCDWEIRRGGVSHSLHTAAHLRTRFPDEELFWIIGADQLSRLPQWHKIDELAGLLAFAVALRNGDKLVSPPGLPSSVRIHPLPARRVDVCSTEIRKLFHDDRPGPELFMPEAAHRLAQERGLYRR